MGFTPTYNKPDAPGIAMNFDNTVSLYYIVKAQDTFNSAAQGIFDLLMQSQKNYPDWPRMLYIDVAEAHADASGHLNDDMFELQQEFLVSYLGPFFTTLDLPLTGGLLNPEEQRNDVPDRLNIGSAENS